MKQIITGLFILLCCSFMWSCKPNRTYTESELAIIPQVRQLSLGGSSFQFKKSTKLVVESIDQHKVASQFAELFEKAAGWKLQIRIGEDEGINQIYFKTELAMGPESYVLEVSKDRIVIKAARSAGFFYATQTLRQLLPAEIESGRIQKSVDWLVPEVSITDGPRFKWRGFMLDVSRHFFKKEEVLSLIDNLALHKINILQLHLVDDQGWRIEIKKYPKLTEIGSLRVDREDRDWGARPKQNSGEEATYGGFYTQDDIREMVAYAQSRFITIVPDIEMPAHISSALAAYPQYSCTGGPFSVFPGEAWPNSDIYCAGKDSTFSFIEDVLTEVMDLFPSKYIHVGGDVPTKSEWEKCPDCKKRMKDEGLKDVDALQSYFFSRVEKFLDSKNRVLVGWDKIMDGGIPPKAIIMSLTGTQNGIEAVKQGHDVIMTPGKPCSFDHYQGPVDQEPLSAGGYNPLSKVYAFSPIPSGLTPAEAKHILGAQANLWTEFIPNSKHAEYMIFPRIAALSEVLWSSRKVRNWDSFMHRIQLFLKRYDQKGVNYSKSAFTNPEKFIPETTISQPETGKLPVNVPDVVPSKPAEQDEEVPAQEENAVKSVPVSNKASGKSVTYLTTYSENYKGSGALALIDDIHGSVNHLDGKWQAWRGKNMEVVIDLQKATEVHSVSVGALQDAGAWIFFPQKLECYVSRDGKNFQKVAETLNGVDPLSEEVQVQDFVAFFKPITTNYVKVVATSLGVCPEGHAGSGKPAWLFIDEIRVE